jgi:hypothetical protein
VEDSQVIAQFIEKALFKLPGNLCRKEKSGSFYELVASNQRGEPSRELR